MNYKKIVVEPLYMFGKSKFMDYISASFLGNNFFTGKSIYAVLTLSASGKVIKVDFPGNKNMLSIEEEHELTRIYGNMPRWQPLFLENKTKACKVIVSSSLTNKFIIQ